MINKFQEYLQFEKRYSPNTVLNYVADINECSKFFAAESIFPSKVTYQDIRAYIVFLSENKFTSRSINRKLSSLRSFYKFLIKIGDLELSPLDLIDPVKEEKKIQIPISKDEMNMLFNIDNIFKEDFEGSRDLLIIELLYQTGIRKSELINLKRGDVDLVTKTIKVLGKRNKERIIPISKTLVSVIKRYYVYSKDYYKNEITNLIITKKGKRIYPSLVFKVVNHYLSLVTTKEKRGPHILRHSFASHLLDSGADLNAIKELLGHSSLASTQVYTNSSLKELKKMYNHTHPRSVKK